jgi:hypothetical protein
MSLQLIAKQMEAKGRNGDSVLVHMTTGEVAGLQKLAESAGGSLSVNPETGLVEANFLKRILPGVILPFAAGMVGGPMAAAAVGATIGGVQAKQNKQDFLTGALLGGVSGYGAGSLGAGLNAAGSSAAQAGAMRTAVDSAAANAANLAPTATTAMPSGLVGAGAGDLVGDVAARDFMARQASQMGTEAGAQAIQQAMDAEAQRFAAQGLSDRAGQGISALMDQGSNVGRQAFMSKVGGGAGLMSDISMAAAAPMMAPGEMPGPPPVDDEMYEYDYDVGRTYAENTPTASSAERKYFDGKYSEPRKIKAKDYRYAEGGIASTSDAAMGYLMGADANGASGNAANYLMGAAPSTAPDTSAAGLAYLMGETAQSPRIARPASTFVAPTRGQAVTDTLEGFRMINDGEFKGLYESDSPKYVFDPAAQKYYRKDDVFTYEPPPPAPPVESGGNTDTGGYYNDTYDHTYDPQRDAQSGGSRAPDWVGLPADMRHDGTYNANTDAQSGGSRGQSWESLPADMRETPSPPMAWDSPTYDSYTSDYNSGVSGHDYSSGSDSTSSISDVNTSYGYGGYFANGGLLGLAKGGMASGGFVVPADVVSALGNGSTDAGLRKLYAMLGKIKPIKGKGDGLSDSIKTNIDGKQPARVADGEAYIDPKTVKRVGGAKKLYAMMDKIRAQAHGKTSQQRKVNPAKVMA